MMANLDLIFKVTDFVQLKANLCWALLLNGNMYIHITLYIQP